MHFLCEDKVEVTGGQKRLNFPDIENLHRNPTIVPLSRIARTKNHMSCDRTRIGLAIRLFNMRFRLRLWPRGDESWKWPHFSRLVFTYIFFQWYGLEFGTIAFVSSRQTRQTTQVDLTTCWTIPMSWSWKIKVKIWPKVNVMRWPSRQ